jgi:hypothetical protein
VTVYNALLGCVEWSSAAGLVRGFPAVAEERTARGRVTQVALPARLVAVGPIGGTRQITAGECEAMADAYREAARWLRDRQAEGEAGQLAIDLEAS